jgi:ComF family protein
VLRPLLDAIAPPLCAGCGGAAGRVEPLCAGCRRQLRWLGSEPVLMGDSLWAWAPLAYEDPARGVVRALKFAGATRAAGAMAAQMVVGAPSGWLAGDRVLVPVPLHPARARKRGYNQAALLASALARRTGLAANDCLARAGPRGTQVGRDRTQRLAGIAGTVSLEPDRGPPPTHAILVDDVITTGATLAACARALLAGGAFSVVAVGYARTPGR